MIDPPGKRLKAWCYVRVELQMAGEINEAIQNKFEHHRCDADFAKRRDIDSHVPYYPEEP